MDVKARGRTWRARLAGLAIALAVHLAVLLSVSLPPPARPDPPAPDDGPVVYLNIARTPAMRAPLEPPIIQPPSPPTPPAPSPTPARPLPVQNDRAASPPSPATPPAPPSAPSPPPPSPMPAPGPVAVAQPSPIPAAPTSPPVVDPLSPFQAEILARLAEARRYPPMARVLEQQGVASVRFHITRGGSVSQAMIVKSTGAPLLDQAALDLLRRVRLPPIPDGLPDGLTLEVNLEYRLQ